MYVRAGDSEGKWGSRDVGRLGGWEAVVWLEAGRLGG